MLKTHTPNPIVQRVRNRKFGSTEVGQQLTIGKWEVSYAGDGGVPIWVNYTIDAFALDANDEFTTPLPDYQRKGQMRVDNDTAVDRLTGEILYMQVVREVSALNLKTDLVETYPLDAEGKSVGWLEFLRDKPEDMDLQANQFADMHDGMPIVVRTLLVNNILQADYLLNKFA